MTIDQWLNVPHTLIGSRAFDIEHADSDYDIVILLKDLPKFFRSRINPATDNSVESYFNLIPYHGRGWVLRHDVGASGNESVDVIVLESQLDINIVSEVIAELQQLPSYYLESKQMRIDLFETGLIHYGWTEPVEPDYGVSY